MILLFFTGPSLSGNGDPGHEVNPVAEIVPVYELSDVMPTGAPSDVTPSDDGRESSEVDGTDEYEDVEEEEPIFEKRVNLSKCANNQWLVSCDMTS